MTVKVNMDLDELDDLELAATLADLEADFAVAEALLIRARAEVSLRRKTKRLGYVKMEVAQIDTTGKKPH